MAGDCGSAGELELDGRSEALHLELGVEAEPVDGLVLVVERSTSSSAPRACPSPLNVCAQNVVPLKMD